MPSMRVLAPVALIAALVVVVILIAQPFSSSNSHFLRAEFSSVEQLVPGLEVRIAGRKVGSIDSITLKGRQPIARLGVSESDLWPLPEGTTAQIHWGSTTSLAYRFVELIPGPSNGKPLANDAILPPLQTVTPVELDQAYRIFRGHTTGDVQSLAGELANTLAPNGRPLNTGLSAAPGGLNATTDLLQQLGADPQALNTLVSQGDHVTSALANKQSDLGALAQHLAGTFDEFAQHTSDEQSSLDQAPQTLSTATTTLNRLDTSINGLRGLVNDIAPGALQLQRLAPAARSALTELRSIAPLATSTLNRGTRAAAPLNDLLTTGTPFLPRLGSTVGQLAPMFACLRPYSPELAGMLGTWTGWNMNYDATGHYARTFALAANPALFAGTPMTSAQAVSMFKGALFYAMPRPPGLNAGKPWFLPQCGAGAASLDPSQDPEATGS